MIHRYSDLSSARFTPATEQQFGEWRREHGSDVIVHKGRYWIRMTRGFYQPINCMARLSREQVSRPTFACWGYRASVGEDAADLVNSSIPMNVLSDVEGYTLEALPAKRRSDLRKCEKQVSFVNLTGPGILQEQGYDVDLSAFQRTGYGGEPDPQHYQSNGSKLFPDPPFQVVLAGLLGDRLGGYMVAYAIDDVAIIERVAIATEALPTAIGTGLVFQFAQLCRRTPGIRHIVYGLHSPEDPRLVAFKEGMGFKTTAIASHLSMPPGFRTLIRKRRPYPYYRLSGILP